MAVARLRYSASSRRAVTPFGSRETSHRRELCLTIPYALAAFVLVACIPVRWTEPGSPWITGQIRGPDGRPAVGLHVAVAGDVDDDACRHPAATTTTDADGNFRVPNTELVHHFFILLPIEKFTQLYRVCGGDSTPLSTAYDGHMAAYTPGPPDSVSCFAWLWHAATHVTCTSVTQKVDIYGRSSSRVTSGGAWTDGASHGFYRVISTHSGPWVVHPQLYLQWLRDSTTVVSTMELTPLTPMTALVGPSFSNERGVWSLVVTGFKGSDVERTLIFELGPPDDVRLVTP